MIATHPRTSARPAPPAKVSSAERVHRYARSVVAREVVTNRDVRAACRRHLDDLATADARGLRFDPARAAHAIDFFGLLRLAEGDFDGKPFVLEDWQAFIVGSLFGWFAMDADGTWVRRFRNAYVETGKGSGKALALDTPIPTPTGWTTMGAIVAGDQVLDDQGRPTRVLEAHDVMHGHDCYAVTFDDGSVIVADAEHLWETEARWFSNDPGGATRGVPLAERGRWRVAVRTTAEIAATLRYPNGAYRSANHSVRLAGPLHLEDADLPIEPYTLGVWLGDGDSRSATLTVGHADAVAQERELAAVGTRVDRRADHPRAQRWRLGSVGVRGVGGKDSLNAKLRRSGLLGRKHIPAEYLRASYPQRLALLQGLMDTDGHISPASGACELSLSNHELASAAHELILSLGIKAAMHEGRMVLAGLDVGPRWRIAFHPPATRPVFRIPRKLVNQRVRHGRRALSQERRIVACDPVPSVPVRCIRVAAESSLFLAGRAMIPTHNTPLAAGIGLYGLAADDEAAPEIYSAAAGRDQAGILWTDAKRMVEKSPALLRRITPMAHALVSPSRSGTFRAVSSEAKNHHGKRVHIALIDELHAHQDGDVQEAMRAGTKGRRNALIFRITNSGFDRQSVCWHDHEYSLRVLDGTLTDDAWFAYVCGLDICDEHRPSGRPEDGCKGCDQWTDESVWAKANPNIGVSLPMRYLREMVTEAVGKPSAAATVKRLCFCIWTEGSGKWLDASAFAALAPEDARRPRDFGTYRTGYGGLDLASTRDLTALALLSQPDDCPVEGHTTRDGTVRCYDLRAEFWMPEANMAARVKRDHVPYDVWARDGWIHLTPGDVTDYDAIRLRLGELREDFAFRAIGHDKWNATQLVTDLVNDGFEMYPVDQGMASINAAAKRLESDIAKGLVHHDGNPVLRWMVGNAAAKQDAYGNIKPDRNSSSEKIDGIAAWCDALHVMLAGAGEESSGYESYRDLSV